MRRILFLFTLGLFLVACQNQPTSSQEKSVEEIRDESKITNSSIVRNPVSANEPTDTVNVAKISFEEESYDFGEVEAGEIVTHVYRFNNNGNRSDSVMIAIPAVVRCPPRQKTRYRPVRREK